MEKIILTKGQAVNLTKETNGASLFEFRAGWDTSLAGNADVDIMAGQVKERNELVYYANMSSADASIKLSGDNRTGEGDGWDETIYIDFSKVDSTTTKVPVFVSIYNAQEQGLNFGLIRNLQVQIYDVTNGQVVGEFMPELENSLSTAMLLGEFVKSGASFFFKTLGTGYDKVQDIIAEYKLG